MTTAEHINVHYFSNEPSVTSSAGERLDGRRREKVGGGGGGGGGCVTSSGPNLVGSRLHPLTWP